LVCHRGFDPDPRVVDRQKVCRNDECRREMRQRTQAAWRCAHPGYFIEWRAKKREALGKEEAIEPPRLPPPLSRLPWGLAQEEFGAVGADFVASMGRLLVGHAKDEIRVQVPKIMERSCRIGPEVAKDERRLYPTESTKETAPIAARAAKDERLAVPP
jgi:hypothetical protein